MANSNAEYRVSTYKASEAGSRSVKSSFSDSNTKAVIQSTTLNSANELITSLSSIVTDISSITSDLSGLSTNLQLIGMNVSNAFSDTGQYTDLVDTAANAATNYISSKIQRVKNAWNTQVSVTIGSIVGEIAPYAMDLEKIGDNLSSKAAKLTAYLTGTSTDGSWSDLLKNLGTDASNQLGLSSLKNLTPTNMTKGIGTDGYDAMDYLKSSGAIGSAISDLSIVQAYAQAFNTISNVIKIVKRIKNIYETLRPGLSIATNLAAIWCTGGASGGEASNTMMEECEKLITDVEILALYALKKFVFSIKIKLPALLVGAVDAISVRDAMLDLPSEYSWLSALFNDQFFAEVDYTLQWGEAIKTAVKSVKNAISDVEGTIESWEKLVFKNSAGQTVSRGEYMKETFMSALVSNYMNSAVTEARKVSYLPDVSKVSWITKREASQYSKNSESISNSSSDSLSALDKILADDSEQNPVTDIYSAMKISSLLYENANSTTDNNKYTKRAIQQMIVNSLEEDGAICNFYSKYYKEQDTYKGGEANRLAFKNYNDKIIRYHSILKVLTGERRANIYEAIPAIDYTNPDLSVFSYTYPSTGNLTKPVDPTTLIPINASSTDNALELIEDEDPYTINRALMGYPTAEHFYNTTGLVSQDYNVQVSPHTSDFDYVYNGVITPNVLVNGVYNTGTRKTNILVYKVNYSVEVNCNTNNLEIPSSNVKQAVIDGKKYAVDATNDKQNIILNTDAGYNPGFEVESKIIFSEQQILTQEEGTSNYLLHLEAGDTLVAIPTTAYSSDNNKLLVFKADQNAGTMDTEESAIEGYLNQADGKFYSNETLTDVITPNSSKYYLDINSKKQNVLKYYQYSLAAKSYFEADSSSISTEDPSGIKITVKVPKNTYTCYILYIASFNSGLSISSSFEDIPAGSSLNNLITDTYLISSMSDYLDIETSYFAKASGLLDGYFCEPYEYTNGTDAQKVTRWKFSNDTLLAASKGVQIDIGSKYFSGHLLNRGDIIDSPLKLTEHDEFNGMDKEQLISNGITGKTTLIYKKLINAKVIDSIFQSSEVKNWYDFTSYKVTSVVTKFDYTDAKFGAATALDLVGQSNPYGNSSASVSKMVYKGKFYKDTNLIEFNDILDYIDRFDDALSDDNTLLRVDPRWGYILTSNSTSKNGKFLWSETSAKHWTDDTDYSNNRSKVYNSFEYCMAVSYNTRYKSNGYSVSDLVQNPKITMVTPRELFSKSNENNDIVVVSTEYNKYFPENVILISKYDLKLDVYSSDANNPTRGICSFLTTSTDGNDKLLMFKVDYTRSLLFSKVNRVSIYDETHGYSKTVGYSGFSGRDCYIYMLSPLTVSITDKIEIRDRNDEIINLGSYESANSIVGASYPDNYFPITITESTDGAKHYELPLANRYTDYQYWKDAIIIPGLPDFDNYSELSEISKDGYNLSAFAKLMSSESSTGRSIRTVVKTLLYNIISNWPMSEASDNPILLKDMPGVLGGLLEFNNDIANFSESGFSIVNNDSIVTLSKDKLLGLINRMHSDVSVENAKYVVSMPDESEWKDIPENLQQMLLDGDTQSQTFKDEFAKFMKSRLDDISITKVNISDSINRPSIQSLYNIFQGVFNDGNYLSEDDCKELDTALGENTKAFLSIGKQINDGDRVNNVSSQMDANMEEFYTDILTMIRASINEAASYRTNTKKDEAISVLRENYSNYYTVESVNNAITFTGKTKELSIDSSKLVINYNSSYTRQVLDRVKNEDDPYYDKGWLGKLWTRLFHKNTIWHRYSLDNFIYKFITSKSDSDSTKQRIINCFTRRITSSLESYKQDYYDYVGKTVITEEKVEEYLLNSEDLQVDNILNIYAVNEYGHENKYRWSISVPTITIDDNNVITIESGDRTCIDEADRLYDTVDVEEDILWGLVRFIKTSLEGTNTEGQNNSYYVKYVEGEDDEPTGRPNSLYYKRYQMLNNRMNRLKGSLWLAASYLRNSSVFNDITKFSEGVTDSYDKFMSIMPISSMDALTYMPAQNATTTTIELPGKFYSDKELQALAKQINNVCVLTCTTCSIKESCPFYDQNEIIKMYCTGTETIDLWVKDNKLDLIAYDDNSPQIETESSDGFDPAVLKAKHLIYSDISSKVVDSDEIDKTEINDLEALRDSLTLTYGTQYTDYVKDDMGWLLGARYGTVDRNTMVDLVKQDTTNEYYESLSKIHPYKYLYDSVFIPDEETYVNYTPSTHSYKVNFEMGSYGDKKLYSGSTKIQIPTSLKIIDEANDTDDVYLISDDTKDADGNDIIPVIYLGQAQDIQWVFDLQDDGIEGGVKSSDDSNLYAADVAQWCMNYYKGNCIGDHLDRDIDGITDCYTNKDQYWMENVYKKIDGTWYQFSGRPRESSSYNEPLIDPDNFDDIQAISGRPMASNYINFIRRVSIRMYDNSRVSKGEDPWLIKWVNYTKMPLPVEFGKTETEQQEFQRSVLPLMKTNLRLAIVKSGQ